MTASSLTSQLEGLYARMETVRNKLNDHKTRPTKSRGEACRALASRIIEVATELSGEIRALTEFDGAPPTDDGIELLSQARRFESDGRLNATTLKRNLTLIFEGPKTSLLDSNQVKTRKRALNERCSMIRGLHPESIVRWAMNFIPSSWGPGTMSNDTFSYLIENVGSERMHALPSDIVAILHALRAEEPLIQYGEFRNLVDAIVETASNAGPSKKRKATELGASGIEQMLSSQTRVVEVRQKACGESAMSDRQPGRRRGPIHVLTSTD